MLCISTSGVTNTPITVNNALLINRAYASTTDLPSFPSRLVFNISREAMRSIVESIADEHAPIELLEEANRLMASESIKLIIPVARRVQDEAYTSFSQRPNMPLQRVNITAGEPTIFINGNVVPNICAACSKQIILKGRVCPDYIAGSFSCFKTNNFSLNYMQTFYLNEKGDLVYNATCIDTESDESQNDANQGTNATQAN